MPAELVNLVSLAFVWAAFAAAERSADATRQISALVKAIQTDKAPAAIGPYSQGIVANGLLFTAGQIALDPATGQVVQGDVVAQTRQVLANLQAIIAAAGASWDDVVKTTVYLFDMNDFPVVNEAYATALALPANLQARIGRFHMPFGKQNTTHRAELHTLEYPWVIQRFLGSVTVEPVRGSPRVWIILAHDRPFGKHQQILDMLEELGTRIASAA